MKINKIIGLERNGRIISQNEFEHHNIFSTKDAVSEYFDKYGYVYVEPYDLSQDLIIVQDKNFEVSMLLGMFYKAYRIINYKTCEVIESKVMPDSFTYHKIATVLPFTHRISQTEDGAKLISNTDNSVVLHADFMKFVDSNIILFRRCNIDYIFELDTYEIYPLIKLDETVYQGPHPEKMVDFRRGMYYQNQRCIIPVDIMTTNIDYLISSFPLGEKSDRLFYLLDNPIKYGISYEGVEQNEVWYDSLEERDTIYSNIEKQILGIFTSEKQKQKIKTDSKK